MGKILIVEDEQDLRELLHEQLEVLGFQVIAAVDGQDGLEKFQQSSEIDVVVSDIKMPRMTGTELLAKIREFNGLVPFVVVTAFGDKQMVLDCLHLGIFDFLDKPYKLAELQATIEKAIQQHDEAKDLSVQLNAILKKTNVSREEAQKVSDLTLRLAGLKKGTKKAG